MFLIKTRFNIIIIYTCYIFSIGNRYIIISFLMMSFAWSLDTLIDISILLFVLLIIFETLKGKQKGP